MPKQNDPVEPVTVSAVDPREILRSTLDSEALTLNNRLKQLYATSKQLDLEIEAAQAALRVTDDAIAALSSSLTDSRERALLEATNG